VFLSKNLGQNMPKNGLFFRNKPAEAAEALGDPPQTLGYCSHILNCNFEISKLCLLVVHKNILPTSARVP